MRLFDKERKEWRRGDHFYFGDFGEIPAAISYVRAGSDEELGQEARHYSKAGHKYFFVVDGQLEIEVGDQSILVGPEQVLMVEPGEPHRVMRLAQAPCRFIVFGTVKDPTGADKVTVAE